MKIAPAERRSRGGHTADGFEISIPARRNLIAMLFLPVWLVGWGFGEGSAARDLLSGSGAPGLFLGVWLTLWTMGGVLALYSWCWMLKGRETILLRAASMIIRRQVWRLGPAKEYDLHHVKNLRVATTSWTPREVEPWRQFWGTGDGPIAFDYGAQTVRLAAGVDEAEARVIVSDLMAHHAFPESEAGERQLNT